MKSVAKMDDAVSPAIATILLAVITIVLAVIVLAFVTGAFGGGAGEMKAVGITAEPFSGHDTDDEFGVILTVTGGADAAALTRLTTGYRSDVDFALTDTSPHNVISDPVVGTPYRLNVRGHDGISLPDSPVSGTFTVTGHFTDGTAQVLYQKSITLEK